MSIFSPFSNDKLSRREGEGGHGGGGHASGHGSEHGSSGKGSSGGKESSEGSKGSSKGSSHSSTISVAGGSKKSSSTSYGGGKAIVIPAGRPFAGRTAGGGTRSTIYGTRYYGSGYPGYTTYAVYERPLPYYYWPVSWGPQYNYYYVDGQSEYGSPSNTSRPGGPMVEATYVSAYSNTTFHILSDNSTIISLIASINSTCSFNTSLSSKPNQLPPPYNASNPSQPQFTSAIQYYRASSITLTLDGYNNTAAQSNNTNAPITPLPSGIDTVLLGCLNTTIGASAPLVSASKGLPAWAIAVIVVGVVILLAISGCIFCCVRSRRRQRGKYAMLGTD